MTTCIALVRGINVGRAKRMAMADLARMFESMGFKGVRTILNSGNVVFQAPHSDVKDVARAIEGQIVKRFGFSAAVVVITAGELAKIIDENPLQSVATDPSRYLVAFVSGPVSLSGARPLLKESFAPEQFAIGAKAAYLWCPNGIINSRLGLAFARLTADSATTRNWATVLKLQAAAGSDETDT